MSTFLSSLNGSFMKIGSTFLAVPLPPTVINLKPMSGWTIAPVSVEAGVQFTLTDDSVTLYGVGGWKELLYTTITVEESGDYKFDLDWTAPQGLDFWSRNSYERYFGMYIDTSLNTTDDLAGYPGARSQGIVMYDHDNFNEINMSQSTTVHLNAGTTYYVWLSYGTLEDLKNQEVIFHKVTLTKL